tara:strand:+ start:1031 stop:1891 length:861 start_codon:yes stop_codon:yes gene_type:complete
MKIWLLLLVALCSVSSSSIIVKYLNGIEAIPIAFARMTIAGLILWTFSFIKPQGSLSIKSKLLTIISGVFLGIHFAFFFSAVKMTTLANATLFGTLAPIFTVSINYFAFKIRINKKIFIGLILTIIGGITMQNFEIQFNSNQFKGDIAAIICSFWMALVLIITKNIRKNYGTLIYSRLLFISAAITLLILLLFLNIPIKQPNNQEIIFLILIGIIPNILGHSVLYYLIRFLPAHTVASIPLGEPIIVSILGLFLFNEAVPPSVIIGGLIILGGLYLILKNSEMDKN